MKLVSGVARIEMFSAWEEADAYFDKLLMCIASVLGVNPILGGGQIDQLVIGARFLDGVASEGGLDLEAAIVSMQLIDATGHPVN